MRVYAAVIVDPADGGENAPEVCIAKSEEALLELIKPAAARYCNDCGTAESIDEINTILDEEAEDSGNDPVFVFTYEQEL